MSYSNNKTAVFGGGCFWCTEAVFQRLKGVNSVVSGYAGGSLDNPSYEQVSSGNTGHVEVVKVEFDPSIIAYEDLLNVFFASHDPTTLNRQGNDVGTQYRSVIYAADENQEKAAREYIAKLETQKVFSSPILTEVKTLEKFFRAEDYHQNFYNDNQSYPYCTFVIDLKVAKLRQKFSHLLREE